MRRWLCTATMDVFGWWERAYCLVHRTRCHPSYLTLKMAMHEHGGCTCGRSRYACRSAHISFVLKLDLVIVVQHSKINRRCPRPPWPHAFTSHAWLQDMRFAGLQGIITSQGFMCHKAKLVYKDFFVDNAMEHNSWLRYVAYF